MIFDRSTRLFLRWRDRGDIDALARLFDRTAPGLLRLAAHVTGDAARAEDVLQDTFLAAIESAKRFDQSRKVGPWLAGILTHRAKAELRRERRVRRADIEVDEQPAHNGDPVAASVVRELDHAARVAIDGLREPLRQPTLLRFVHHLEPAEIALLLDRSPATVRSQIHRGIECARRALPRGAAIALAVGLSMRPGLAAVRAEVLSAGAAAVTTKLAVGVIAAGGFPLAGVFMSKPAMLSIAAGFVCLAVLVVALRFSLPGHDPDPTDVPTRLSTPAETEPASVAGGPPEVVPFLELDRRPIAAAPSTGGLQVEVGYDDGTAAPGVEVRVHEPGVEPRFGALVGRTGARGRAEFERVPAGRWLVRTDRAPITDDAVVDVQAGEVTTARIVIVVRMRIEGRVVDESGRGVAGARVYIAPSAQDAIGAPSAVVTDGVGCFLVASGFEPTLIGAHKRGFGPSRLVLLDAVAGPEANVQLLLPSEGGSVQGAVLAPDGAAVEGALVRIGASRLGPARLVGAVVDAPPRQVATDVRGRFDADGVLLGEHEVCVRAAGLAPWFGKCRVKSTPGEDLVVTLEPGCVVRGCVRDEGGHPIAGCRVSTFAGGELPYEWAHTDEAGNYELSGLPTGPRPLAFTSSRFKDAAATVACVAEQAVVCDLVLSKDLVLTGLVVDQHGRGVRALVRAIAPNRKEVGLCMARDDGRFELVGMPEGVVDLWVEGPMCDARQFHAVATDESPLTLEVHAKGEPTARVTGVVVGPAGQTMPGVRLTLLRRTSMLDSRESLGATNPRDGRFDLGPVSPGTYRLRAEHDQHPRYLSAWRSLEPFEIWDVGELRLEQGGWIRFAFPEDGVEGLSVSVYDLDRRWLRDLTANGQSPPLRAGRHLVRVHGPASAELVREVEVVAGEGTDFAVIHRPGFACEFALTRADAAAREEFVVEVAPSGSLGRVRERAWIERQRVFVESRVLCEGPHLVRVVRGGVEHEQVVQVEKSVDVQRFEVLLP